MINPASTKLSTLKSVFGHDSFRPLQEEAINAILENRDVLMILPTGGGKSLCYQLPSLLMSGVTVVISPLLALMHDQVTALLNLDIAAGMISSIQNTSEIEDVYERLLTGDLKLLYVAPERFKSSRFMDLLGQIDINFFVVDEAHCVSEWGHEFREDYRRLHVLRENFPGVSISTFTATATPKVQIDIASNLKLNKPEIFRGPVFRNNMQVSAAYRNADGRNQLLRIIDRHPGENGIIYTFTRNSAEAITAFLQKEGIKALAYHAGLPAKARQSAYHDFVHDEIHIIVATIAFGMGIDKSNIRFIIHLSLPKTIENYYQEIGRAGRDGLPCRVYLLFSIGDKMQRKALIDQLDESPYKLHSYAQLEAMTKYAESENCRHAQLAAYFEDPHAKDMHSCQTHCDNCLETGDPDALSSDGSAKKENVDITREAQMFLSAVLRSEQRFGANYIIDLLLGSKNQKVLDNGHTTLTVYGIGKERARSEWHTIAQRLQELKTMERGEYQELIIRPEGLSILKKETFVSIRKDRLAQSAFSGSAKTAKKQRRPEIILKISPDEKSNLEQLKLLRSKIAREQEVPAYIVFNDKTLIEMATRLPVTSEEMLDVGGVGERKLEHYGDAFLALCRELARQSA
ncbi:MAG: ATP-dependent DNA helicase [Spirochaetia bacterium]|nr:ATP-dependent DNA helicase [Spirochaetia bacterium]